MTDNRYYLIENRQYVGYDATLAQGPYNFSEAVTRPNWVEFFTFQDGMLVWLVDPTAADNNTSVHPGSGYALPVAASSSSSAAQASRAHSGGRPKRFASQIPSR